VGRLASDAADQVELVNRLTRFPKIGALTGSLPDLGPECLTKGFSYAPGYR
jgi:hypothetical protein